MGKLEGADSIFVALDVPTIAEALALIEEIGSTGVNFKVGLELLHGQGTENVITVVKKSGGSVFADPKLNDIPNTVGKAAARIASFTPAYFNVMAATGRKSIRAAIENKGKCKVLAVTVLTSIPLEECIEIYGVSPEVKVTQLAKIAVEEGVDGIICAPVELPLLTNLGVELVTPAIRPKWAKANDQERITTPGDAIKAGATGLVIGRPITKPPEAIGSSLEAVKRIAAEICEARAQAA